MSREGEPPRRLPLEYLRIAAAELERRGYFWMGVEREHTEAGLTDPLEQRLRGAIKRRGFGKLAGHVLLTFGYDDDPREIYDIPAIRAYFQHLDSHVPELPALVAYAPEIGHNGPGHYLMLLGEIGRQFHHPERGGYDVEVLSAQPIVDQAVRRIRESSQRYHLPHNQRLVLEQRFIAGTRFRLS